MWTSPRPSTWRSGGRGAPGGEEFTARIGALYAVAYGIRMARKLQGLRDYKVSKLEAQYWGAAEADDLSRLPRAEWHWRLLVRTSESVGRTDLSRAIRRLLEKGKGEAVRDVELVSFREGLCVQMLHLGPYNRAAGAVASMKAFAASVGLVLHGRYHEIYRNDPRRTSPERLRTIVRLPVKKAGGREET